MFKIIEIKMMGGRKTIHHLQQRIAGTLFFLLLFSDLQLVAQVAPPVINSSGTQSIPENTPSITLTASNPPITGWNITGGADQNKFTINSSGVLSFIHPPDYENPTDQYADNKYNVTITATNARGTSAQKPLVITVTNVNEHPDPPSYLYVISQDKSNILKWTASSLGGATLYRIYRSQDSITFSEIGTSATTSYTDNNLVNGRFYFYRVTADSTDHQSVPTKIDGSTPYPDPIAKYMHFDGSGDYLVVNDTLKIMAIPYNNSSTIECWVRFTSIPTSIAYIISRDYNALNSGSILRFHSIFYNPATHSINYTQCVNGTPGNTYTVSSKPTFTPAVNTWYHIAATYPYSNTPGSPIKLYINGSVQDSVHASNNNAFETWPGNYPSDSRLVIGATTLTILPFTYSNFFNGDITEVRIWNTLLDSTAIKANMFTRKRGDEAGLLGLWHLDTMYHKQVYDYDNLNFNATVYGDVSCATPRLIAVDDYVSVLASSSININVRGNDNLNLPNGVPTSNVVTKIIKVPSNGTASVLHKDSISYSPNNCFIGKDTIKYLICDTTFFGINPYIFSDTAIVVIYIYDNENPTVTSCPSNVATNNDPGNCSKILDPTDPVFADNCSVTKVTWAMSGVLTSYSAATGLNYIGSTTFPVGATTISYTAYDAAGNTNTCSFDIVVSDNQNPTITPPAEVIGNTDAGSCAATSIALGTPVTTDNCGVAKATNDAPSLFPVGTTIVTWTVTDIHDNTATATQNVNVSDNRNPTITAPADVIVNTDAGSCTATGVILGNAITADNCGVASVSNNAPTSFPAGTTIVTWTVTDIHDNTSTATQNVNVSDNRNPTITAPADVIVNTDAGSCAATSVALGTPVTADNCGVASVTNDATSSFPVGTTIVTWTVTDIHDNTSTATQNVIVNDNQNPTITAPADLTVNTDAGLHIASGVALGTPVTTDNCGVATVTNNAPTAFPAGPTTITWTVTDIHRNAATATQTVTVIDNTAPTITSVTTINVTENTTAVMTVTATDTDIGDILTFSISGGTDAAKFTIDANTGELKFITAPDYEIPTDGDLNNIYMLNITVTDAGKLFDTKAISVIVGNINDAPTNIILSKNSVYEELPVGTMVGTLTTIDQDAGDSHIYEILPGNDAISFIISGDILRTTAVFDYKVKSTYSITIRTADQGGLYFDKPFTIIVNNVNEAPKILDNNNNPVDTLYFDAYENETLQVCLNVFDPDGDNVSITDLRLLEGKVKLINSSKTCLSYLSPSGFIGEARFFVQVCDNGAPSLCDSAIIIFNVHPRFIISQAISPNEDEIDDTWLVQGIERYPNNTITIFSRWGDLVYKVKHYDNTNTVWKGQYNTGQKSNINVPDGTYFYIIEIDGMNKPLSGYIVVKR